MSMITLIIVLSLLCQFLAAFYALFLIRLTGIKGFWIIISIAFFLMSVRRLDALYHIFNNSGYVAVLYNELIALGLSFFLLFGVHGLRIIFVRQKQTEEQLQKEMQFSKSVIDNISEGICVCHNIKEFPFVKFTVWNSRMTEITGYSKNHINQNGWYQTLYPDPVMQAKAIERMSNMRQGGDISREEWVVARADGLNRVLSISTSIINSTDGSIHVLGLMQDITDRKQQEESIRSAEALYHNLVETSQDLIWQCDFEGRYTYLNPAWEDVFGYKLEEMLGRKFSDFQSSEMAIKDMEIFSSLIKGNTIKGLETVHLSKNGKEINLIFNAIFLSDINGNIIGTCGTAYDITNRKHAEDKIKSLLQEKELILKEVHHRIKNNMNTIVSLLILQSMYLKDSSAIAALQDTKSRVESMVLLYDKLYCSTDYKNISVTEYLPPLIDGIIKNFSNSNSVSIVKEIDDFILELRKVQPVSIIINELLTNIMKYAFNGRADAIITVSVTLTGKMVSIKISDNGNGIPESVTFEKSPGFGMQLVSLLTAQIGGSIKIIRGDGTTFVLEFDS